MNNQVTGEGLVAPFGQAQERDCEPLPTTPPDERLLRLYRARQHEARGRPARPRSRQWCEPGTATLDHRSELVGLCQLALARWLTQRALRRTVGATARAVWIRGRFHRRCLRRFGLLSDR